MSEKIRMMPRDWTCPNCHTVLTYESHLVGDEAAPRKKGDIVICSTCTCVLQVGDSNLRLMSQTELGQLDPAFQITLKLAIQSIRQFNDQQTNKN